MTGLEKLYNIVRKEEYVLSTSIYAWTNKETLTWLNTTAHVWMNYGGLSM